MIDVIVLWMGSIMMGGGGGRRVSGVGKKGWGDFKGCNAEEQSS